METYRLPKDVTGITTLKTGWTKRGVLTLTGGILDPGYDGPISTAVINFSKTEFNLRKGEPFFRSVFLRHSSAVAKESRISQEEYLGEVISGRALFSDTFLTVDKLIDDLIRKVFRMPSTALRLSLWGVLIATVLALASLFAPPAWNVYEEILEKDAHLSVLSERILQLEQRQMLTTEMLENERRSRRSLEVSVSELRRPRSGELNREKQEEKSGSPP